MDDSDPTEASYDAVLSGDERLAAFVVSRTALSRRRFVSVAAAVNLVALPLIAAELLTYVVVHAFRPGRPALLTVLPGTVLYSLIAVAVIRSFGFARVARHRVMLEAASVELDAICAVDLAAGQCPTKPNVIAACVHLGAVKGRRRTPTS